MQTQKNKCTYNVKVCSATLQDHYLRNDDAPAYKILSIYFLPINFGNYAQQILDYSFWKVSENLKQKYYVHFLIESRLCRFVKQVTSSFIKPVYLSSW